jgi:hypothetical protein
MSIDINDVVNVIIEQRNTALNKVAELTAIVALLNSQLKEAKKDEPNAENTDS